MPFATSITVQIMPPFLLQLSKMPIRGGSIAFFCSLCGQSKTTCYLANHNSISLYGLLESALSFAFLLIINTFFILKPILKFFIENIIRNNERNDIRKSGTCMIIHVKIKNRPKNLLLQCHYKKMVFRK